MGERIRNFSVKHAILFCVAVEILGLAALSLFGRLAALALPEADEYIQMLLQELAGAAVVFLIMKLCGMDAVVREKGYGFASGLLPGMYFLVGGIYAMTVFIFLGFFAAAAFPERIWIRPWYLILAYALCMMMVGVFEEFLFRGIIAGTLLWHFGMTSRGVWKAVALSGALFGCAHLINLRGSSVTGVLVQCAVTVMVGMVFSAVYFRSGCIWAPVFLHGFWDMGALALTGVFDTNMSVSGIISGYTPLQLLGAIPHLIVLLVILRPSMMAEGLVLWRRKERPGSGAKAPKCRQQEPPSRLTAERENPLAGEERTEKAGKTGREE